MQYNSDTIDQLHKKSSLIFFLGLLLRVLPLFQNNSLWGDEQASVYFAKLPFFESLSREHAPLFSLIFRSWVQLANESVLLLRLLPLLFSILTLYLVYRFFRNPLVLLFYALNPISISFATEIKFSSILEFLIVLLLISYRESFQHQFRFFKLSVISILASLTHPIGLLASLGMNLAALFIQWWTKKQTAALMGLFIFQSVIAIVLLRYVIKTPALEWLKYFENKNLFLLVVEPFYVLNSYSWSLTLSTLFFIGTAVISILRNRNESDLFMNQFVLGSFLLIATFYMAVAVHFKFYLGFYRFLIPILFVYLLTIDLSISRHFQKKRFRFIAAFLVFFIFIQSKKIVEDRLEARVNWPQEVKDFCDKYHEPIFLYAHASWSFYFKEPCYEVKQTANFENSSRIWLIHEFSIKPFLQELYSIYGSQYRFERIGEIGFETYESAIAYRVTKNETR